MIFLQILCIFLLFLQVANIIIFVYQRKKLTSLENTYNKNLVKEKESIEEKYFKPYLALILKNCKVYNDIFEETEEELTQNTFYTIVFEKNNFGKLLNGQGWVKLEDISSSFTQKIPNYPVKVIENTTLKNGPSLGYEDIASIKIGEVLEANEQYGAWRKVKTKNNKTGFILQSTIK